MARKEVEELEYFRVALYKGDFEKLRGLTGLPASKVIRTLVRKTILRYEEKMNQEAHRIEVPKMELGEDDNTQA